MPRRINPNKRGAKAPKQGEEPYAIYKLTLKTFPRKCALEITDFLFQAAFMSLAIVEQGDTRTPLLNWVMDRAYEEHISPTKTRIETDDGEVIYTKVNRRTEYVPAPVLKP
jgi:hypothetical protein